MSVADQLRERALKLSAILESVLDDQAAAALRGSIKAHIAEAERQEDSERFLEAA